MTDAKKANGSKKTRSPAVPSYSLQESIGEVHKIYDAYGRTGISKSEVASALKMSSDSGPFNSKIFTLKEYGLLDGSSDEYRVSQAFMDLKENGPGTSAFKRAALAAIKRSTIFAWLLTEFPTKLPAAEHLATRLETQKEFNHDRAQRTAAVLTESMKSAQLLDSNNNILPIRDLPAELPKQDEEEEEGGNGEDSGSGERPKRLSLDIPLSGNRVAKVYAPADLTSSDAQKIGKVLQALSSSD